MNRRQFLGLAGFTTAVLITVSPVVITSLTAQVKSTHAANFTYRGTYAGWDVPGRPPGR